MDPIQSLEYKGYVIEILYDEDAESPREWDNLGEMLYRDHSRYILGDRGVPSEEIQEVAEDPDMIHLPVYAYVHSGITINTTGFSCPWDSGQCGIIYVSKARVENEYGSVDEARAKKALRSEVQTFDSYLRGDVYGYVIKDKMGNDMGSLYGCYGFDYCVSEAKSEVDYMEEAKYAVQS